MEERMLELARSGMACSQIMLQCILEWQGMENPDLIRAMGGLTRGMGRTGRTCGVLTAGCCAIALFTEKGDELEEPHPDGQAMLAQYADWFAETVGGKYGGCDCKNIVDGDFSRSLTVCFPILQEAMEYIMNMLMEKGVVS